MGLPSVLAPCGLGTAEDGSNRSIAAGPIDRVVFLIAKERAMFSEDAALAGSYQEEVLQGG